MMAMLDRLSSRLEPSLPHQDFLFSQEQSLAKTTGAVRSHPVETGVKWFTQ